MLFCQNKPSLPDFSYETKLLKKGFKNIAGLDEVGRGSLAGPIVAGAVILNSKQYIKIKNKNLKYSIKDSKKLSPKQREKLFEIITSRVSAWAIGAINEKIIDKIGIAKANALVIKKAAKNLNVKPDFLLIDGNLKIDKIVIPNYNVIKGDEKIFSCACASILAKVYRDRLMKEKFHKKYQLYGFDKHKGYGTKYHLEMIERHGLCPLHRKSFKIKINK
ncbi:MAG: ribonuclease HII [Parcubacteria group bacterium Athens1014_10]|nr:MAG: ribonuclease HII [Parcubacteria group bacterium Athens1014_10]TSD05436.1 MAG: ribonuclease HII [Parcubacteria group bacterium Athens0714_12]